MYKRTTELRFVARPAGKEVYRILQQRWIDDDPPDEGATRYEWRDVPLADAPKTAALSEAQIKYMVNRFLSWTLPENFNPDGGVSFRRLENRHHHPEASPFFPMPSGTNLFDATQADAMMRYLIDGIGTAA